MRNADERVDQAKIDYKKDPTPKHHEILHHTKADTAYPLRRTFRSKGLVHFGYVRRTTILDIFMQWFRDVRPDLVLGLPDILLA